MILASIQTVRPVEQKRDPRNKTSYNSHMIFSKNVKAIQWKKDSLFNK